MNPFGEFMRWVSAWLFAGALIVVSVGFVKLVCYLIVRIGT